MVIWLLGCVWQDLGEFNMKGLAYIVGAVLGLACLPWVFLLVRWFGSSA